MHLLKGENKYGQLFTGALLAPAIMLMLLCASFTPVAAQDPTFSQYNLNQYYYNPAYTGNHGGYQLAATYRSLWPGVPGKVVEGPLSTSYAMFDAYLKSGHSYTAGVGVFAMQDVEGEGFLTTNTVGISYAQHFAKIGPKTDAMPRIQISVGFKAYLNSISVNWDKLVFSDDLSLTQGVTGSSSADHSGVGHKITGDADAGLLMINNFKGKDNWYNEVGFAMAHIISPNESLTGADNISDRVPRKYVVTYRSTAAIAGKRFFIGPTILFENQALFYELNTGLDLFINPRPSNVVRPLCFTVMNRLAINPDIANTNAIILAMRYKGTAGKNSKVIYNIGFSVDLPYSGLAMQTRGAYEVSLNVIFPRTHGDNFSACPYQVY
jgi:type IX secretion system PorP/SprF family membrane protein